MRRERADGDRARARERRAAEEAHLEQRLAPPQLVGDQRDERHAATPRTAPMISGEMPAHAAALDDRVGQRRQRDDHEHLADRVEPARPRRARLRARTRRSARSPAARPGTLTRNTHRQPTESTSAPPTIGPSAMLMPTIAAPHADRLGALARVVEHVADDRHRDRVEHRAADRLEHPGRDRAARGVGASAHSSEPSENTTRPIWNTLRRGRSGRRSSPPASAGWRSSACTRRSSTAALTRRRAASGGSRAARR